MDVQLYQHIELLLGSVGVILGLFFAAFLILTNKAYRFANVFLAIYLLAFSLRIGKSLFHNYFEIDASVRTVLLSTLLAVGPSIWLYIKALIKVEDQLKTKEYLHFLPLLIGLSFSWLIPNDGTSPLFAFFYNFLIAHMLAYTIGHSSRNKPQSRKSESRIYPNVSKWLNAFLGINVTFLVMYFLISEMIIPFYMGMSLLFSVVVIVLAAIALRDLSLFQKPFEKYGNSRLEDQDATRIMTELKLLMEQEKPYLRSSLNLAELGESVGVSSKWMGLQQEA
ncbi:MAG: hypothetical protein AAFN93_28345 [Bacteroidota bacterium]